MATTSSFSISRVAQLYRYNAPWLKKQILLYLGVSLVVSALYLLGQNHFWQMAVYALTSMALSVAFILSPLVFAKGGDTRIIERLIPATPAEKFVFHISYLLIFVTLSCYLLPFIAKLISPAPVLSGDFADMVGNAMNSPVVFDLCEYGAMAAGMITCLYFITAARRGRVVKAIMLSFAVIITFNIITAIATAIEAFKIGVADAQSGVEEPDPAVIAQKITEAVSQHTTYAWILFGVIALFIIWMLTLTYRALYRKNL